MALLDWARSRNAVIVEDDYDGEFRYDGQPLESLQGLDSDSRVIYVGTFSRTMYASLRVGYIVAPPSLVAALDRESTRLNSSHALTSRMPSSA